MKFLWILALVCCPAMAKDRKPSNDSSEIVEFRNQEQLDQLIDAIEKATDTNTGNGQLTAPARIVCSNSQTNRFCKISKIKRAESNQMN